MVQRVADVVRDHLQALHISSEVTGWFRKEREPQVLHVTPERVLATLRRAGINCVLMGTHAINTYRDEARATQDVDVLVTKKDVRKAVRALEEKFPYLEVIELSAVTRFLNSVSQKVVIDVMKPTSRAMQVVFRHTISVGKSYRIPTLEMALVSKFIAMFAPNRKAHKRIIDLGDFMDVVANNRDVLDLGKLTKLADAAQPHGGQRIVQVIEEIDAGRQVQLW
jgi:hypothetical protein